MNSTVGPLDLPFGGKDTRLAVKGLSDHWLVVGPIRACIHLANVWHMKEPGAITKDSPTTHRLNGANVFGPLELDHDWTTWAAESERNYTWLYFYAIDLCDEYLERFGRKAEQPVQHGARRMLSVLENMPECLPDLPWSEPTFAKDIQ